ncbi:MAG: hypothetical protein JNK04_00255 [Myxococcales bacterium]|nr:hypothetical protein [Myxococcales bacterium]
MVSATQQSSRIRARKARKNGKMSKRENRANGTPKFPIQPAGYDSSAPDAKKPAAAPAPAPAKAKKPAAEKPSKAATK